MTQKNPSEEGKIKEYLEIIVKLLSAQVTAAGREVGCDFGSVLIVLEPNTTLWSFTSNLSSTNIITMLLTLIVQSYTKEELILCLKEFKAEQNADKKCDVFTEEFLELCRLFHLENTEQRKESLQESESDYPPIH